MTPPTTPPTTERRKALRAKAPASMTIRLPGITPAQVRDISMSGVCCTTDRPVPPMSQVHLVLVLPSVEGLREVACDGAVVRCVRDDGARGTASSYETAIYFTGVGDTDRAAIAEYVSVLRTQGAVA